jgi:microtubule-associated protein-like 6
MGCSSSVETSNQGGASSTDKNQSGGATNDGGDNFEAEGYDAEEQAFDKSGNPRDKYHRDNDAFEVQEQGEGEQFMATKAWKGAMFAPENAPSFNPNPPPQKLTLEYCYGYRAIDSRNNLFYNANGHAVYMSAALGIVLNQENNTQTFFGGKISTEHQQHNDDVSALALSPDRKRVATGQVGKQPRIFIWDAETGEVLATGKQSRNTRCTKAIGWNHDGTLVATLGYDNDHTVAVFDASNGNKVAETKGGSDPMVDLAWHPSQNSFTCAAKRGISIFTYTGNSLQNTGGIFGKHTRDPMTCITFG